MLRGSPARITSPSPSPRRHADGTFPRPQLDQELQVRHRAERVLNTEVRTFGARIGWIAKTFDYINCVTKCFRFRSMRVCGHTLLSRCYASPSYILHDRRKILKLLRSPTVASEPGLCVDVICTSRTQRVVGDNSHTTYHQRLTLI